MPSIIVPAGAVNVRRRLSSAGAARPGGLESLIWANGLVINDQDDPEQIYVKNVDGLWGTEVRDQREAKVNDDGEDVYDTLLGGKLVTITGHINAYNLDRMRDMEQAIERAFPHDYDYPVVFDRSRLRYTGLAAGATIDKNWAVNPSFEIDTSGYETNGIDTLTREQSYQTKHGDWHARFDVDPGGGGGTNLISYNQVGDFSATQDDYIQVGVDIFITDNWDGGAIRLQDPFFRSGGVDTASTGFIESMSNQYANTAIRNNWQRVWVTVRYTDVLDADEILFGTDCDIPASGGAAFLIDGLMIRVLNNTNDITQPTYFDGESAGWVWEGDLHASTSVPDEDAYRQNVFIMARRIDKVGLRDEQSNMLYKRDFQIPLRMADPCIYSVNTKTVSQGPSLTNLAPNPSIEVNTTGYVVLGSGTLARSTLWASRGTASLRVTSSAAGVIGAQIPTGTGGIAIPGGLDYSASVDINYVVKSNGASGGALLFDMYFYDASGTIITGSATQQTTTLGFNKLTLSGIHSPNNARFMQIRVYTADNVNAAVDFRIDGIMINVGPTVQDYFDGSVTTIPDTMSWWSGTAHNSQSRIMGSIVAKNHGSYKAKPRLVITGPWTNFGITNQVLLEGETVKRKFSFTGTISAGMTATWDEESNQLIDSNGVVRDGWVDASANGLRLGPECTSILTLAGTGVTDASGVALSWEDTWK